MPIFAGRTTRLLPNRHRQKTTTLGASPAAKSRKQNSLSPIYKPYEEKPNYVQL